MIQPEGGTRVSRPALRGFFDQLLQLRPVAGVFQPDGGLS